MMRVSSLAIFARIVAIRAGGFVAVHIQCVQPLLELLREFHRRQAEINLKAGVAGWIGNTPRRDPAQAADALHDPVLQSPAVIADQRHLAKLRQRDRGGEFAHSELASAEARDRHLNLLRVNRADLADVVHANGALV